MRLCMQPNGRRKGSRSSEEHAGHLELSEVFVSGGAATLQMGPWGDAVNSMLLATSTSCHWASAMRLWQGPSS